MNSRLEAERAAVERLRKQAADAQAAVDREREVAAKLRSEAAASDEAANRLLQLERSEKAAAQVWRLQTMCTWLLGYWGGGQLQRRRLRRCDKRLLGYSTHRQLRACMIAGEG